MQATNGVESTGFLVVYKPTGISSYDAIRHIKRIFKRKLRIGHAGTLDPIADGLLIIAIGRVATRELSVFGALSKCYKATGKLGVLTDSLDKEGAVLAEQDASSITRAQIEESIISFGSSYQQIPPIYAAVKYQGVPLYQRARSKDLSLEELQKIAAQKVRLVQLYKVNLVEYTDDLFTVDMCVSQGTYVRSMLNDIAHKINNFATTQTITRYALGTITLQDAVTLSELQTIEDVTNKLLTPQQVSERFGVSFRYK